MKTRFFLSVSFVLMLIATSALSAGSVSAETVCDPTFVKLTGNIVSVTPTGVDDTANLQCAFDAALAIGAGAQVRLSAGTFHTAQIVVNGFDGVFTGVNADTTVITNLPNLYVTPVDFHFFPPSAATPWPSIFTFVDGNIAIADLAIKVTGDNPTMGWTIFGIDPPLKELAIAVGIIGTEADVRVDRVLIEGGPMENSMYGYNLINGIYFEGIYGDHLPWPPLSGSFDVYNSTFKHLASGAPSLNLINATVIISHNRFEDVFDASDAADMIDSSVSFTHNQVDSALFGFWHYSSMSETTGSSLLIKNNIFRGIYGPVFEGVFGEGNECLILGNNVQNVTEIGVYLGPDIKGCTVVGGSNKTNVFDEGSNNILVGVNNMGTGIGPTIHHFMKIK